MKFTRNFWLVLALAALLTLALSACAPVASPGASGGSDSSSAPADGGAGAITIQLAENPWTASSLNVHVAKILLEEQLGHAVEIVSIDENAQWPALSTGDLSASLEVWPSGHAANVSEYIDSQGSVVNGGELGVIGKIGWYVPTYVVDANPELATWEGYSTPEAAALFATAETGANGQFLSGDPSFVQYDQAIIDNLGLPFQVVYAGSEEAILAALDSAVSREAPLLFYFWTPHSVHAKYDLTEVALPEHTEECYADPAAVDCDYPSDVLFKIFWSGLEEAAPDAYTLLSNMSYSTEDQIAMIADVELNGLSLEDAARAWLDANEGTWQGWLP